MSPVELLLAKLRDANRDVRKSGNDWSAQCPAHEDRQASLSIAEGDDGRALIYCHAGCTPDAICGALGMKQADLFAPHGLSTSTVPAKSPANGRYRRRDTPKATTFASAQEAISELECRHGLSAQAWTYHDADGEPVGVVVRWNRPGGRKVIRPVSRHTDGWRVGGMTEPRPLYHLRDLAAANRVYFCEGEKAAEALRSIGLTATTTPHGANSPHKADLAPLAGKEVVVVPDNDDAGWKYAKSLLTILATLQPAPVVKVVELPNLPDAGDVVDWIDAYGDSAEPDELRRQLEAMADAAEPINLSDWGTADNRFKPFPLDALPDPVRGFVAAAAKAIGCDVSYVALPLLAVLASAIGNARRLRLKRSWTVAAILWTVVVGESGTHKTPALNLVMRPIRERERKAFERHAEAMREYEAHLAHYDKDLAQWKRDNEPGDPPEKPTAPQGERFYVSDTTVEALAPLLRENPRGLLLMRDELAGWFGSFDRYANRKSGADEANWLSMHSGEAITVDRKTGNPRTIYVPMASVSVCGGIQPAILRRALGKEHWESGLAARLLVANPPRHPKQWTEADIDQKCEAEITSLFDRLYELQPAVGQGGQLEPVVIDLTPDAKAAWTAYFNANAQEQSDLSGDLAAAWSKLEESAARLALVIHFARWAANDRTLEGTDAVDAASMAAGIKVAEWFKHETRRVYAMLSETEAQRDQRRLIEFVERKGGAVTPREVQQGCRWVKDAEAAETALQELVSANVGNWEPTPRGQRGQPTRRFRLAATSAVYGNTSNCGEKDNTVDVDG